MKRLGIALAAIVLSAGCGGSEGSDSFTAKGTFTLKQIGLSSSTGPCEGRDGYQDIRPGVQVVVRDATGKDVGLGRLGDGTRVDPGWCEFPFTVTDIPESEGLYTIEVSKRGGISFKRTDAAKLALTLG